VRVIGGEFRSRPLKSLPGLDTRPTPDRLREALFNILAPTIEGKVFADLYAGTGAVGIEALSRGARRAIFVERSRAAVAVIRQNLKALGLEARAEVRQARATPVAGKISADIVFLDPPYQEHVEYAAVLAALGETPPGLVIVQHDARTPLAASYGGLVQTRLVKQGDNRLAFYLPARP
jgi:16S rRNA (guanine(966)-N(2))-methyltransferase RsmD